MEIYVEIILKPFLQQSVTATFNSEWPQGISLSLDIDNMDWTSNQSSFKTVRSILTRVFTEMFYPYFILHCHVEIPDNLKLSHSSLRHMPLPTVGSITLLLVTNGLLHHFGFFPVFINRAVQDYKAVLTVCFGPSSM